MIKIMKKYGYEISDLMIFLIAIFTFTYIVLSKFKINLEEQETIYLFLLIIFLNIFLALYFIEYFKLINFKHKITKVVNKPSRKLNTPFLSIIALLFLAGAFSTSKELVSEVLFTGLVLSSFYFLYVFRSPKQTNKKTDAKNIVIIGAGNLGTRLLKSIIDYKKNYNVIGFIDDNIEIDVLIFNNKKVIGHIKDLSILKRQYNIEEVFLSLEDLDYSSLLKIIDEIKINGLKAKILSPLLQIIPEKKLPIERLDGLELIVYSTSEIKSSTLKLKRIGDVVLTSIGMIFLLPVFIIIGLLIKLGSKGPIIFKQIRIGRDGKPFEFYKFRSMFISKGEDEERKEMMLEFMKNNKTQSTDTKIINEKRVTWIGKYLRKTSLDELPQLFNVLKGDMSLVGPRPCLPYEYENYEEWHKRRLNVLPGCTGVWQVSGRSSVMFDDSVVLDLYYINNISVAFDLKIMANTIPVMFFSKGGK